ncbi:MAG TPA: hypothetical protein VGR37_12730 [Longimicrobiaceae bacterium]|nr:hypothetical protein [Longimicrobiaceae bacterium]
MNRIVRSLIPTLSLLVLLVAPGCADRDASTPLAPTAAVPSFNETSAAPDLAAIATFRQRPAVTIAWAKKWIGPEGGRLDFQGFAIDVPAGAVDKVTMFSINLPVDPKGSEHVVAEFGPHNKSFAVPVTIELPLRGTSIEGSATKTIVWWNNGWVDMGGAPTADGARLRTRTDHFSTYATTDTEVGRGGTISASGG